MLLAGPIAVGLLTELWACRRVAEVVRREVGVYYHPPSTVADSARPALEAATSSERAARSGELAVAFTRLAANQEKC